MQMMMEGHGCRRDDGVTMIRKGPWMAEEDEILMDYVKKYGPRDWSAIRSKGLLPRTGKSCRLRWVNKLKPDLKTGCKFSAEEERTVIELQAQFGNKWAKIATYLKGRTDNDVKNFWSTRQKRLARLLQASPTAPARAKKNNGKLPMIQETPADKISGFTCTQFQQDISSLQTSKPSSCVGSSDVIEMVRLPDLLNNPDAHRAETSSPFFEYKNNDVKPCSDFSPQLSFVQIPLQPALDFAFFPECQDPTTGLVDSSCSSSSFLDMFTGRESSEPVNSAFFAMGLPFTDLGAGKHGSRRDDDIPKTPDSFFDDFPADMFDQLEPLPSSTEW